MDVFAFVARLAFELLLLFAWGPVRFRPVFDLTRRRFDAVFDFARFFAFFMILPISIQLGADWASIHLLASSG
jgi:hypothetical protein